MEQRLTKMLIRIPQAWKIPEGQATSESVYLNRRQILAAMGLPTILPAANRNPQFTLDRPLTEEWAATSYNNYYEFSTNKQEIRSLAKGFKPRPWTVEIAGACAKPQVWSIEDLEAKMPIEERLYPGWAFRLRS
jgi:sulfoxide reductase catalytic subunit YedY